MLTRRPRRQIKEAEREDYGAGRFGHGDLGGSTAETASRRPTTGSAGQGDPSARHRALQEQARFGAFLAGAEQLVIDMVMLHAALLLPTRNAVGKRGETGKKRTNKSVTHSRP